MSNNAAFVEALSAPPPRPPARGHGYQPLEGLTRHLIRLSLVTTGLSMLGIVFKILGNAIPIDLIDEMDVRYGDYLFYSDAETNLSIAVVCVALVTLPVWCMWNYRANQNLRAFTDNVEYTPSAAVLWWFVPLFNYYKPYLVMAEICRKSSPDERAPLPPMLKIWWTVEVLSSVTLFMAYFNTAGDLFNDALTIAAAIYSVLVTQYVMQLQVKRHAALQTPATPAE